MFQDAHIHIQDIKNPNGIRSLMDQSLSTAGAFGRFFNCAITPADWPLIKSFAEKDPRVVPFFGFHPWFGDLADTKSFELLEEYLAWPPSFAGEMGLDRACKNLDFELQKDVFRRQLELAAKYQKPFAVHCVRAWAEVIDLIKKTAPGLRFLMHSFNGSKEIALEIERMGGYCSVPVRQFLKTDDAFKGIFRSLPLERILIETDFPYQVKWTTPSDYIEAVHQGYTAAAAWRDMPIENLVRQLYDNGTMFVNTTLKAKFVPGY